MLLSFVCQRSPTKRFKPFPANQKVGKQEYHWVCSTLYLSSQCLDLNWTPNETQSEGRGCMCIILFLWSLGLFAPFSECMILPPFIIIKTFTMKF